MEQYLNKAQLEAVTSTEGFVTVGASVPPVGFVVPGVLGVLVLPPGFGAQLAVK